MIDKFVCFIFADPRDWTREDLHNWLKDMQNKYSIKDIKMDRFLMNGRALVLMKVEMFLHRVPRGGELLFREFRTRLEKAIEADRARARARILGIQEKGTGATKVKVEKDNDERVKIGGASPARDITNEHKSCPAEKPSPLREEKENVKPDPDVVKQEVVKPEVVEPEQEVLKTSNSDSSSSSCDTSSSTKDDNKQDIVHVEQPSGCANSPPPPEGEQEVERPESPILDVTTVDDEDTTLEGGTPVTCVA